VINLLLSIFYLKGQEIFKQKERNILHGLQKTIKSFD